MWGSDKSLGSFRRKREKKVTTKITAAYEVLHTWYLALGSLRHKDHKFKGSPCNTATTYLKTNKNPNTTHTRTHTCHVHTHTSFTDISLEVSE